MSSETEFIIQDREKARPLSYLTVCRIETLFSVQIRLTRAHPSQAEWVTVSGSQENIAKAKSYILALCTPEFGTEVKSSGKFTDLLFGENSRLRNELEREYQTVVLPSHSGNSIHIQGCEYSVCLTVSRLTSLMDTMNNGMRPSQCRPPPSSVGQPSASLDQQLQDVIQQMGSDSSNIQKLSEDVKQALLEELVGERPLVARDPGAMFDPLREQRIEFFVRLDYPREKVEAVLDSLGPGATENDILSRLVKVSSKPVEARSRHLSNSRARGIQGEPLLSAPMPVTNPAQLRPIVIDGSNVAMRHGNGKEFSCVGILIAVQWFLKRGHQEITVFVPSWRKEPSRPESPISGQEILYQLESDRYLVFTPSRRIGNKRIVCYDDRFIVRLASMNSGVIVSNDNYRDLINENSKWRETIEQRLLMFTFVNDIFMVPEDPLGRHGPSLDRLLLLDARAVSAKGSPEKQPQQCPYADRCTFGKKCRYYHPERENREKTSSPVPERRMDDLRCSTEDLYHPPGGGNGLELSDRMHRLTISRPDTIPHIVEPYDTRFIPPTPYSRDSALLPSHPEVSSARSSYSHPVTYPIANLHPHAASRQTGDIAFHRHSMSHSKSHGNIPMPEQRSRDQDPPGLTPRGVGDLPHRYSQPHFYHNPYRGLRPYPHSLALLPQSAGQELRPYPHSLALPPQSAGQELRPYPQLPPQSAQCVVDYRSLPQQRHCVGYSHEPMLYPHTYRPDISPRRPQPTHMYAQWGYNVERDGPLTQWGCDVERDGLSKLFKQAAAVLPDHEDKIHAVMLQNPHVTELERLVELVREMD